MSMNGNGGNAFMGNSYNELKDAMTNRRELVGLNAESYSDSDSDSDSEAEFEQSTSDDHEERARAENEILENNRRARGNVGQTTNAFQRSGSNSGLSDRAEAHGELNNSDSVDSSTTNGARVRVVVNENGAVEVDTAKSQDGKVKPSLAMAARIAQLENLQLVNANETLEASNVGVGTQDLDSDDDVPPPPPNGSETREDQVIGESDNSTSVDSSVTTGAGGNDVQPPVVESNNSNSNLSLENDGVQSLPLNPNEAGENVVVSDGANGEEEDQNEETVVIEESDSESEVSDENVNDNLNENLKNVMKDYYTNFELYRGRFKSLRGNSDEIFSLWNKCVPWIVNGKRMSISWSEFDRRKFLPTQDTQMIFEKELITRLIASKKLRAKSVTETYENIYNAFKKFKETYIKNNYNTNNAAVGQTFDALPPLFDLTSESGDNPQITKEKVVELLQAYRYLPSSNNDLSSRYTGVIEIARGFNDGIKYGEEFAVQHKATNQPYNFNEIFTEGAFEDKLKFFVSNYINLAATAINARNIAKAEQENKAEKTDEKGVFQWIIEFFSSAFGNGKPKRAIITKVADFKKIKANGENTSNPEGNTVQATYTSAADYTGSVDKIGLRKLGFLMGLSAAYNYNYFCTDISRKYDLVLHSLWGARWEAMRGDKFYKHNELKLEYETAIRKPIRRDERFLCCNFPGNYNVKLLNTVINNFYSIGKFIVRDSNFLRLAVLSYCGVSLYESAKGEWDAEVLRISKAIPFIAATIVPKCMDVVGLLQGAYRLIQSCCTSEKRNLMYKTSKHVKTRFDKTADCRDIGNIAGSSVKLVSAAASVGLLIYTQEKLNKDVNTIAVGSVFLNAALDDVLRSYRDYSSSFRKKYGNDKKEDGYIKDCVKFNCDCSPYEWYKNPLFLWLISTAATVGFDLPASIFAVMLQEDYISGDWKYLILPIITVLSLGKFIVENVVSFQSCSNEVANSSQEVVDVVIEDDIPTIVEEGDNQFASIELNSNYDGGDIEIEIDEAGGNSRGNSRRTYKGTSGETQPLLSLNNTI